MVYNYIGEKNVSGPIVHLFCYFTEGHAGGVAGRLVA